MTIGTIVERFDVKCIEFTCLEKIDENPEPLFMSVLQETNKKTINAFQMLMAGGRGFPEKKASSSGLKSGLSSKDLLYNDLVDSFIEQKLDFPKCTAQTQGSYFIQYKKICSL